MRRILALILTVLLVMSVMNFSVLANENSISFSVKVTEETNGDIRYTVDIKGLCDANDRVLIKVVDESGTTLVIEQLTSNGTGNFALQKTFSES